MAAGPGQLWKQEERHMPREWAGGRRGTEGEGLRGLGPVGCWAVGWEGVKLGVWPLHQGHLGLFGEEASGSPEVLQDEGLWAAKAPVSFSPCGDETKVIRCL